MYWVKVIIIGIVITESRIVTETKDTESSVSPPNLPANIVDIAATGAENEIAEEIKIVPLTPQRYKTAIPIAGKTTSRNIIARIFEKLLNTFLSWLFAK